MPAARPIKTVGFLLIPGFALLSYTTAMEPLRAANQLAGRTLYRWWHATPGNKPALASNGVSVLPDYAFDAPGAAHPDLLFVCAGGNPATFKDRRTFAWLRRQASHGVTLGGVSGGPFILAKAGLLNGYRCTVHWEHQPALEETFPHIQLTRSIFEMDRDRITCSGGVAGLDMMVALIARDHGLALAASVSEWFLHTHIRDGARPQRMDLRLRLGIADDRLLKVLREMEKHLERPLSRRQLAESAGVSLRQLERSFRDNLAQGVHRYYLSVRLRRAGQLLRETSLSVLQIAVATGFSSPSQFSRAFRHYFGLRPREFRQRSQPSNQH